MSGAANVNPRALVRSLDDMLKAGTAEGWDALEAMFQPALVSQAFRPDDQVLQSLGALSNTEVGRQVLDWLFDLTNRAPFPRHAGQTFEAMALAAKAHEARAAVGEVILAAVVEGRKIIDSKQRGSE